MEKQPHTFGAKSNRTLRPQKPHHKLTPNENSNDMDQLAKKIQILEIQDLSQTNDQSIDVKKPKKKSISKGQKTKVSKEKIKPKPQNIPISPQYLKLISTVCQVHTLKQQGLKQKLDANKLVTPQWFNKVTSIWEAGKNKKSQSTIKESNKQPEIIKKTQRINYLQTITVSMLKRLKPKHWLNDEIINSYIQLMDLDLKPKPQQKLKNDKITPTIHLVQSYFATLKATSEKIQRQIKKRCLTKESTIIIPINDNYHWFFLIISNHQIFICDSILPKNLNKKQVLETLKLNYSIKSTIRKCFQLYEALYQIQQISMDDFHVIKDFPQQDNQNDCGMMMLYGMKNVLTKFSIVEKYKTYVPFLKLLAQKDFWNFCQNDIKFLRFLFTRQLMEEKILFY